MRAKLTKPVHWLAFGFGAGLAPKAPGTFGTLVGIPFFLLMQPLPLAAYLAVLTALSLAGIWICGQTADDLGTPDHSGIVWDEICGYLLTMTPMLIWPPNGPVWLWLLVGFALFRLFDIWKPWPISWADRHVKGGWGVMLDDLLAGVLAGVGMVAIFALVARL